MRTRASIDGGVNPAKLYWTDLNKVSLIFFLLTSVIYRYLLYVALFALTYISISSTRPTPLKAAVWSFFAEVRICMFYCLILRFSATVIFLFLFLLGILSDEWRVESNLKNPHPPKVMFFFVFYPSPTNADHATCFWIWSSLRAL